MPVAGRANSRGCPLRVPDVHSVLSPKGAKTESLAQEAKVPFPQQD